MIFTGSSTISKSLIDAADKDEVDENGGNKTNLSNPFALKKSTGADYLTSKDIKKVGNNPKKDDSNTKKGVKAVKSSNYLVTNAKKAFNHLRHIFIQMFIFQHFDPEWHIRIETDASGYAISRVLSQLILDDLGWWHPVAYYLRKIITVKTWYKTHDSKLLAIVEAFKT